MKLLDAYCGAGLAALGYTQAGFECTGIDIEKKSCYAGGTFVLADALEVLKDVSYCRKFDAIHASPPCQRYSKSTAVHRSKGKEYPDLISETRQLLDKIGRPYVIENVPSAPIRHDIVLLGHMFGLNVIRKRAFELGGWFMLCPLPPKQIGSVYSGDFVSIFGKAGYRKHSTLPIGWEPKFKQKTILKTWHYAMGIPEGYNFRDTEVSEGIPPAYTKYIGEHLIQII